MAFKEGFSGCLGVGCAIVFVLVAIPVGCVVFFGGVAATIPTPTRQTSSATANFSEPQNAAVPAEQQGDSRPKDLVISDAAAVYAFYQQNEVKADIELKNKWFAVRGKIERIGKDILNSPYVALDAGDDSIFMVQCMFSNSDQNELAELSPGQTVVIAGKCAGKLGNVLLRECYLYDDIAKEIETREASAREAEAREKNIREQEAREKLLQEQKAAEDKARTRKWTSSDGKFAVEAKFIKSNPTAVTLEKLDGTVIDVPLEKLCEKDLQFIKKGGWKVPSK